MKEIIPQERYETIRQEISRLLSERKFSAAALSKQIRKPEKEIYDHLDQLNKSGILLVTPAECGECGYRFEHRERAKKPGKCPKCKSTHIEQPLFSLKAK